MDLTKINEYFEGEYVEKRMTAYEKDVVLISYIT